MPYRLSRYKLGKYMPSKGHIQAVFNKKDMERVKKVQGDKTDYRFFREAVIYYVERAERGALADDNQEHDQGRDGTSPRILQTNERETEQTDPPFIRKQA